MTEFCQLALKVPLNKVQVPCMGQLKYNGVRVIAFIKDGNVIFSTRNQKLFTYPKLEKELLKLFKNRSNYVLDGELCFGDSKGNNHTKVSGLILSSQCGTPIPDEHKLSYNVFDMMPLRDWDAKKCTTPYSMRLKIINNTFDNTGPFIVASKTWHFESLQEIQDTYNDLLLQKYEGLILKYADDFYEWKRSKRWIKMKAEESVELLCEGVTEGKGKYVGKIGALCCSGVVEGKDIKVNVASGLEDHERDMPPEHFIGKTIETGYNSIIREKKTLEWSLFLPTYLGIRIDK